LASNAALASAAADRRSARLEPWRSFFGMVGAQSG
jgi:hypothetical protein